MRRQIGQAKRHDMCIWSEKCQVRAKISIDMQKKIDIPKEIGEGLAHHPSTRRTVSPSKMSRPAACNEATAFVTSEVSKSSYLSGGIAAFKNVSKDDIVMSSVTSYVVRKRCSVHEAIKCLLSSHHRERVNVCKMHEVRLGVHTGRKESRGRPARRDAYVSLSHKRAWLRRSDHRDRDRRPLRCAKRAATHGRVARRA